MKTNQYNKLGRSSCQMGLHWLATGLILFLQTSMTFAEDFAINNLDFSALSGGGVQLQLEFSGALDQIEKPKIFQTDNPARIAIDFNGIKSNLAKKIFPVNQGSANTVYVMESEGRTRLIINLLERTPFQTQTNGNKFLVLLQPGGVTATTPTEQAEQKSEPAVPPVASVPTPAIPAPVAPAVSSIPETPAPAPAYPPVTPSVAAAPAQALPPPLPATKPLPAGKAAASGQKQLATESLKSKFLPEQTIKSIDFRRGPKGEGRLLIGLAGANTVVDSKEKGGKVVLNFLNTHIVDTLIKSFDVSDFATPVHTIEASPKGGGVSITVTPHDGNYDFSSYQSDNLLTVEFRPLTAAEKEAIQREKFPYVGNKLSLNFQDIEVRSVLQILADFTELNIIAADTVSGAVTLRLNDVPWDQALDLILRSKGLSKRETGSVIMVAPTAEITKIEQAELESKKIVQELEPLKTENIQIKYAKAEDIQKLIMGVRTETQTISTEVNSGSTGIGSSLSQNSGYSRESTYQNDVSTGLTLLSARGSVHVDLRTNLLIVNDTTKQLEAIRRLVAELDIPVRQVLIEARIVIASTNFARDLGVKFGVSNNDLTTATATATGNGADALSKMGYTMAAAAGPLGTLGMTLASGANYLLSLEIDAMQNDGKGELLSNPRVVTSDRQKATIKQGVQIPYVSSNLTGTTFVSTTRLIDAVLQLQVTPQITPDGSVIMEIDVKKDSPGTELTTGGLKTIPIDTRQVQTKVQVHDGETIVLGGVFESTNTNTNATIPWFGELPGLGWLFTPTKSAKDEKKELLIFVTPKILKDNVIAH